jgi:hypothetical protein
LPWGSSAGAGGSFWDDFPFLPTDLGLPGGLGGVAGGPAAGTGGGTVGDAGVANASE